MLLITGCTQSTNNDLTLTFINAKSADPFILITLSAINTNLNADETYARFFDNNTFDIKVPVIQLTNDSITVSTPPYFNDGKFTKGDVNVQLVQVFNQTEKKSNLLNLNINELPLSHASVGLITLNYLRGLFNATIQLSLEANNTIYDSELTGIEMLKNLLITELLYTEINNIIQNNSEYYLGSIDEQKVTITKEILNNTDRLIMALFNAQSKVTLREPGVLKFADESSPGCIAKEARDLSDTVSYGLSAAYYTEYFGAPIKSVNCKTAQAFTDSLKVIMGSSGAALGLLSLAGAPAAIASAGLLYINIEIGGGLILLGGALRQETDGARQLVLEGYERLKEAGNILKENTLSKIEIDPFYEVELPEPFDDILDVWTSVSDLHDLLTKNETVSKFVKLTVYREGDVYGTFIVDKTGLNSWGMCTHECNMLFRRGETINIKPVKNNLIFEGWSNDCTGNGDCVLVMNSDKNVKMTFREDLVNLTINLLGNPYGIVNINRGIINSDFDTCTTKCTASFNRGTSITLTGIDYGSAKFTEWGGDCTGSENCNLVMDSDKSIIANYNSELVTLTVNRQGDYYGTFSIDTGVFDSDFSTCTNSCSATIAKGTTVTITPIESEGTSFTGWSGDCTGTGNCVLVMDSNKTVTESFSSKEVQETFEPEQTTYDLSVSMTSDFSTSIKASGSWGTECNYVLTTSGTASGPVDAKVHIFGAGDGAEYFSFNGWTKHSYANSAQRLSGQPESVTWTSSYSLSCITGDYPIEVYATVSIIGPTGVYYSESTTKTYYECNC